MLEGPSDGRICEADLLLEVDEKIVTSLAAFEDAIDRAVGADITLHVWRDGQQHKVALQVKDLFSLVPEGIFEYAGSLFEDLQYSMALERHLPLKGVFISRGKPPLADFGSKKVLVESINENPTPNLDAFIEVARQIPGQ